VHSLGVKAAKPQSSPLFERTECLGWVFLRVPLPGYDKTGIPRAALALKLRNLIICGDGERAWGPPCHPNTTTSSRHASRHNERTACSRGGRRAGAGPNGTRRPGASTKIERSGFCAWLRVRAGG